MSKSLFDLRQLEAFAAVMSTGSVTGAARLIGRSQPVVTRQIQDLENDIGFELFARHGRRISPTQNGAMFYREVEHLLHNATRTRQRAVDIKRRQIQCIEIVASASLAATIVPRGLEILRRAGTLPENVVVTSQVPEEAIQRVATRSADIGIVSLPVDHPGLDVHWIAEASCVCVLAEDDPLARHETVPLRLLEKRSLITLSNPYRVLGRISAAVRQADVVTDGLIRTNSSMTAISLVKAGLGVAILEPLLPFGLDLPGVVVRPIDVSIPYLWGIVSPLGLPASPVIPPLIAALIEAADTGLPGFQVRDPRDTDSILKNIFDLGTAADGPVDAH